MSSQNSEQAFTSTIIAILESIGNSVEAHEKVIGGNALKIAAKETEKYAEMLRKLSEEYEGIPVGNDTYFSDRLSLLSIHHRRSTLVGSTFIVSTEREDSETARLGGSRAIEDVNEVTLSETVNESLLEATRVMDKSAHAHGYLADESDLNGTVCSRAPSLAALPRSRRRAKRLEQPSKSPCKNEEAIGHDTLAIFDESGNSTLVQDDSVIIEN